MKEILMQEIIIRCPFEVLDEEGLTYVDREVKTGGRRLDIVLRDRRDRYVLVEAQVGHLDTKHIDRHIDFCEGFKANNPNATIRILYVANMINPYQKEFLHRRGYEFKEVSQHRLHEIAQQNGILSETGPDESTTPPNLTRKNQQISISSPQSGTGSSRGHGQGYKWDHNQPDNQDGFINSLIKKGKTVEEIISEFKSAYPKHANHKSRVVRHIKHLVTEHNDFPYNVQDGRFVKRNEDN